MTMQQYPLSVIIHTKNSENTLGTCLESVSFAQEVIVVDMESTDKTRDIAQKYSARVVPVKDEGIGYADPVRNFGLQQATQDWILVVDSDEQVSPGLKDWLIAFLQKSDQDTEVTAYRIPRRNFIFKQEIQHTGWWPDYQVRFFRKGKVSWPTKVHGVPEVTGQIQDLPADRKLAISHDNYPNVEQFISRMNRYTSITAKENASQTRDTQFSEKSLITAFTQEFNRRFFEWEGYKDGGVGVALSFLQSSYELLVTLKEWEQQGLTTQEHDSSVEALNTFSKEIQFWYFDYKIKQSVGISQLIWKIRRKLALSL